MDQCLRLRDTEVKPTLSLEALDMMWEQRRSLTAVQRAMVQRTMALARRRTERAESYWRRRETLAEAHLTASMVAQRCDPQRYRYFTFHGHAARFEDMRLAGRAVRWRDKR